MKHDNSFLKLTVDSMFFRKDGPSLEVAKIRKCTNAQKIPERHDIGHFPELH